MIPGTRLRITVTTLPKQTRAPKPLWLWWRAATLPNLERVWQAYRARFQQEHFFKGVAIGKLPDRVTTFSER